MPVKGHFDEKGRAASSALERALDIAFALVLLGLLGYTAYKGLWVVFAVALCVLAVKARYDLSRGYGMSDEQRREWAALRERRRR